MRSTDNPYSPGAGTPPPELAGREDILDEAATILGRTIKGRVARSLMLLGLRGVGKTVLLNRIEQMAGDKGCVTCIMEADNDKVLPDLIIPHLTRVLLQLDSRRRAGEHVRRAFGVLRGFASAFAVNYGAFEIGIRPESGTGDLALDLADVLVSIGEAASAQRTTAVILVDEVQYLAPEELAAVIVALHRVSQRQLPVLLFGAGLPQLVALAGEAKSYAERLFFFREIGSLSPDAARRALTEPARREGVTIDSGAVDAILAETEGYPYFLQLLGYFAWEAASKSPITQGDVEVATAEATRALDSGFFSVRLERLSERQREYVFALARLGSGPASSTAVADELGISVKQAAPARSEVIKKGVAYSPRRGLVAFTVPKFDEYLRRVEQ